MKSLQSVENLARRRFCHRLLVAGSAMLLSPAAYSANQAATYTVRKGDTLSGIARDYGISLNDLKRANNLKSDLIRVGQVLTIPSARQGDHLAPVIAATKKIRVDHNRWRYIVAHHSAIEQGNAEIYGKAHRRRGMEHGLAYHFVIGNGIDSGDGEIEIGPRWTHQLRGGHVRNTNVNDTGIGICLVGNLENHPPTAKQLASFVQLVDFLRDGQVARKCEFTVHRWVDRNHTVCPGRHFPYESMRNRYRA